MSAYKYICVRGGVISVCIYYSYDMCVCCMGTYVHVYTHINNCLEYLLFGIVVL